MKHACLAVTYRKGRLIAAYYSLPRRNGDHSVRTERQESGLIVDYAEDGRPIGIEITSPSTTEPSQLRQLLARLGFETVDEREFAPLATA